MCEALSAPELFEDQRFTDYTSRSINVGDARDEVQKRVGKMTQAEILARLEESDVPCGPVRTVPDIIADPHFYKRRTLTPMRHGAMDAPVPAG